MIPSSRDGSSDEFNLFPWDKKCHSAWHEIFINMTILEVWDRLDEIHDSIFSPKETEKIRRRWLDVCDIPNSGEKKHVLEKEVSIQKLQCLWFQCFKTEDFNKSLMFIKYQMLFMVFGGIIMMNLDIIFQNSNLKKFLNKELCSENRKRAFEICFGQNPSVPKVRSIINRIIKKTRSSLS